MELDFTEFDSAFEQQEQARQQRLNVLCQFRMDIRKQGYSDIVPEFADMDEVREVRTELLTQADVLINKAFDADQDTSALKQYRQALRDVTEQSFDFSAPFNPFPPLPSN